jgi:hypothetical protein
MRTLTWPATAAGALLAVMLQAAPSQAQASRTWVSGVGDDANPCSRTAPCKTFAGAISKTAASGEINCMDPGGFGTLTITKNITVDCAGTLGGVLSSGGVNGFNINTAGVSVILRNLSIDGAGSGSNGINFLNGTALHLENVTIFGFRGGSQKGINFAPSAGVSELTMTNSMVTENGVTGIHVQPTATGSARVVLHRVQLENNGSNFVADTTGSTGGGIAVTLRDTVVSGAATDGVRAVSPSAAQPVIMMLDRVAAVENSGTGVLSSGVGATVRVTNSTITNNVTGLSFVGGAALLSYRTNQVAGNSTNGTFSGTLIQD